MAEPLNGNYKLTSSDNFDGYLREIGVPEQLVQLGNEANAETKIIQDADDYTIVVSAGGRDMQLKFKLGEEFEETLPHGVKVKSVVTRDGNKLIQTQTGGLDSVITREFNGDELIVTLAAGSVTGTRKYTKAD